MRTVVEIHRGDEHLITGELIYVYKDPVAIAPAPIPDGFRAMVTGFEKLAPEGALPYWPETLGGSGFQAIFRRGLRWFFRLGCTGRVAAWCAASSLSGRRPVACHCW